MRMVRPPVHPADRRYQPNTGIGQGQFGGGTLGQKVYVWIQKEKIFTILLGKKNIILGTEIQKIQDVGWLPTYESPLFPFCPALVAPGRELVPVYAKNQVQTKKGPVLFGVFKLQTYWWITRWILLGQYRTYYVCLYFPSLKGFTDITVLEKGQEMAFFIGREKYKKAEEKKRGKCIWKSKKKKIESKTENRKEKVKYMQ